MAELFGELLERRGGRLFELSAGQFLRPALEQLRLIGLLRQFIHGREVFEGRDRIGMFGSEKSRVLLGRQLQVTMRGDGIIRRESHLAEFVDDVDILRVALTETGQDDL